MAARAATPAGVESDDRDTSAIAFRQVAPAPSGLAVAQSHGRSGSVVEVVRPGASRQVRTSVDAVVAVAAQPSADQTGEVVVVDRPRRYPMTTVAQRAEFGGQLCVLAAEGGVRVVVCRPEFAGRVRGAALDRWHEVGRHRGDSQAHDPELMAWHETVADVAVLVRMLSSRQPQPAAVWFDFRAHHPVASNQVVTHVVTAHRDQTGHLRVVVLPVTGLLLFSGDEIIHTVLAQFFRVVPQQPVASVLGKVVQAHHERHPRSGTS